jgi:hypothetical protein
VKPAVRWLREAAPAWFTKVSETSDVLVGQARVPKTPWAACGLELKIQGTVKPRVGEAVPGTALPARCPERHIQGDRTFCTGLRYISVKSRQDADAWWRQLEQFLVCQGVASKTGRWPIHQALDHGDAGKHHERALALAVEAGVEDEYAAARLGDASWLTDPKLRLFDKKGLPINGRAACPRRCQRTARGRTVPMLRTDCEHLRKPGCHKRMLLIKLAFEESRRREELAKYWLDVIASGEKCCRTVRGCPLAAHEDGS